MKEELELKLVKQYPTLYSKYKGDMRETCMAWGLTCGDGWYEIIDELSSKLEPYGVVAAQVKEKFGGLRFYLESYPKDKFDEIHNLIQTAEMKSFTICEVCGSEEATRKGKFYVQTLCDKCFQEIDDDE